MLRLLWAVLLAMCAVDAVAAYRVAILDDPRFQSELLRVDPTGQPFLLAAPSDLVGAFWYDLGDIRGSLAIGTRVFGFGPFPAHAVIEDISQRPYATTKIFDSFFSRGFDINSAGDYLLGFNGPPASGNWTILGADGVSKNVTGWSFRTPQFNSALDVVADDSIFRLGKGVTNLADLLEGPAPWSAFVATDINDQGFIAGYGAIDRRPVGFVLTPVPEPSVAWIALFGLVASGLHFSGRLAWVARSRVGPHPAPCFRIATTAISSIG